MNAKDLEALYGSYPISCPLCSHPTEHHLAWAHDGRDVDEFDPTVCRNASAGCYCRWLVDMPNPTYGDPKTSDFDLGYRDGLEGRGYRPTSVRYTEGYESGDLAAIRLGLRAPKASD